MEYFVAYFAPRYIKEEETHVRFIQNFRRPGYTIEVGKGENPLPLSQFSEIYRDNVPLLNIAAIGENNS